MRMTWRLWRVAWDLGITWLLGSRMDSHGGIFVFRGNLSEFGALAHTPHVEFSLVFIFMCVHSSRRGQPLLTYGHPFLSLSDVL